MFSNYYSQQQTRAQANTSHRKDVSYNLLASFKPSFLKMSYQQLGLRLCTKMKAIRVLKSVTFSFKTTKKAATLKKLICIHLGISPFWGSRSRYRLVVLLLLRLLQFSLNALLSLLSLKITIS